MKKVLCVLLVVLVFFPSFAQGSKESQEMTSSSNKKEITFWDMNWGNSDYPNAGEQLVEKFNASQDEIKVTYQSMPWDNYYQVFLTAIKGGVGPDVATAGSQTPIQFAQMGEILPLDSIMEDWKNENNPILQDYSETSFQANYFNDQYIALPSNGDPRVFTYRTDYFEQAGIEKMPTTWAELIDTLKILKKTFPDKVPLAMPADLSGSNNFMIWATISNATGPVDGNGNANFDNPRMKEVLEFVQELQENDLIPRAALSYKDADVDRMFMVGDACITLGGLRMLYLQEPTIADKVGIMPSIKGPSAPTYQNIYWCNSIAAYKQTKYPEASKTFIKWWLENNISLWTEGKCNALPLRKSYFEDSYFQENIFAQQMVEKIVPYYVHATYPLENFYPAFGQINGERYMGEACQKVLSGRTDIDKILLEQQEKTLDAVNAINN
jgi:multiple sugar transport system substrate-binding protein